MADFRATATPSLYAGLSPAHLLHLNSQILNSSGIKIPPLKLFPVFTEYICAFSADWEKPKNKCYSSFISSVSIILMPFHLLQVSSAVLERFYSWQRVVFTQRCTNTSHIRSDAEQHPHIMEDFIHFHPHEAGMAFSDAKRRCAPGF